MRPLVVTGYTASTIASAIAVVTMAFDLPTGFLIWLVAVCLFAGTWSYDRFRTYWTD